MRQDPDLVNFINRTGSNRQPWLSSWLFDELVRYPNEYAYDLTYTNTGPLNGVMSSQSYNVVTFVWPSVHQEI